MKQFYCLVLFASLFSCKENKEATSVNSNKTVQNDTLNVKEATNIVSIENLVSDLRLNQKLKLGVIYSDNAEFVEFNGEGDYSYFVIKKDDKTVALTTNLADDEKYARGDVLDIKWKIDSSFVAGDGERLELTEWFVSAKKVKDGPVSLFRKKYKKEMKYHFQNNDMTTGFKDYLYMQVEYYLANSQRDLVKANIQDPNAEILYSIEDRERDGRSYTVLGVASEFEHRTTIIQWLYLDNENRKLYEYDLANDKLIEFN